MQTSRGDRDISWQVGGQRLLPLRRAKRGWRAFVPSAGTRCISQTVPHSPPGGTWSKIQDLFHVELPEYATNPARRYHKWLLGTCRSYRRAIEPPNGIFRVYQMSLVPEYHGRAPQLPENPLSQSNRRKTFAFHLHACPGPIADFPDCEVWLPSHMFSFVKVWWESIHPAQ